MELRMKLLIETTYRCCLLLGRRLEPDRFSFVSWTEFLPSWVRKDVLVR